jgi:hypothetical protein
MEIPPLGFSAKVDTKTRSRDFGTELASSECESCSFGGKKREDF